MVKEMLTIAPLMTFILDSSGNYPLHIAICNQQCYVAICDLFKAFLEVRKMQDAETYLEKWKRSNFCDLLLAPGRLLFNL